MSVEPQTSRALPHTQEEAVKTVPLYLPEDFALAAPAAPPKLIYHGGPLLTNVKVFTVFWGSAWQHPPQDGLAQNLNQFFKDILTSPLIDQLAEYNTPTMQIGHGQ